MIGDRRIRQVLALMGASLVLALAACTSAGTPAAPAGASPTTAAPAASPAATSPATVAPTTAPTAAPTTAAATATTVSATAAAAPAATKPAAEATKPAAAAPATAPAAPAGSIQLTLAPDSSEARYRAREQLVGRSLPSDAVGSTRAVTGTIVLMPNGAIVREQSKITIDLRTLKSDESRRDRFIQGSTLETGQYPNAEFVPTEARGLPAPLPTDGEASFDLAGDLTVHGVTRPTVWKVTARFAPQEVTGTAALTIKLDDFGMTTPRVGPVLSIEENLQLELDFRATRAGAGAAHGGGATEAAFDLIHVHG